MNENLLQYALIGNLFGGESRRLTKEAIEKSGFKPEYVTDPALRTAYDVLMSATSDDRTLLMAEAQKKLNGETLNKCAENASTDPADYERVVLKLKDAGIIAAAREKFEATVRQNATGEFVAADLARVFGDFSNSIVAKAAASGYTLANLPNPIAEEDDPDCLLHGRFLKKGSPLVLTAASGVGKSVIALQLAYAWALGRPIFGLKPPRPLKIGIFQTEDDEQEMAGFRASMRDGYRVFHKWTEEDIKTAEENIIPYKMDGQMGDDFVDYLRRMQLADHCDVVIVNPLQGVTDFDISNNTDMRVFVRKKLDSVIKREETKCGLLIIHHTNKPLAPNMRQSAAFDSYAQYGLAGAAELTNWMRAMLYIDPVKGLPGRYHLVAAKRGKRLGWAPFISDGKEAANPTKLIRYSTPEERIIFWHEVTTLEAESATAKEKPCVTKDAARLAALLQQDAQTLTGARKLAVELFKRKRGEAAYEELIAHLEDNNVVVKPTGKSNQGIIGSPESVEKYFSMMEEKEAAEMRLKLAKKEAEQ